jgi:hypothetical protein
MSHQNILDIVIETGPKEEGILYHYTSQRAMHSIIENNSLWVSHVYYMNDANEIKYGCNLFKQIILDRINHEQEGNVKQLLSDLKDRMDFIIDMPLYLFVFSLSEKGNLLSQWRGYTPLGAGVSIGFGQQMLQLLAQLNEFTLIKCVYEKKDQDNILYPLLDKIITQFAIDLPLINTKGIPEHQKYMYYLNKYTEELLMALCYIKDPAFKEECEWRLVSRYYEYYTHEDIKFREGNTTLIPYIELNLSGMKRSGKLFEEVVVGPSSNFNLSFYAVICYLSNKKACSRTINSLMPYRHV